MFPLSFPYYLCHNLSLQYQKMLINIYYGHVVYLNSEKILWQEIFLFVWLVVIVVFGDLALSEFKAFFERLSSMSCLIALLFTISPIPLFLSAWTSGYNILHTHRYSKIISHSHQTGFLGVLLTICSSRKIPFSWMEMW